MSDSIFEETQDKSKMQRAVIAGASEALKIRAKEWKKQDQDILQDIADQVDEIIDKID